MYFVVLSISFLISTQCTPQFRLLDVKLPQGMDSHFATIYNHTFTVFGGRIYPITNSYITTSESTPIYTTLNNTEWSPNSITMPLGVSGLWSEGDQTVRVNDKLYIINPDTSGGSASDNHQMFIYNLQTNEFTVSITPTYESMGSCSVYNSKNNIIYMLGGSDGTDYQKYNQRFNISSNEWMTPGKNTVNLKGWTGCSMDVTNDHIFYFGGYAGSYVILDDIEKYTVSTDEWTLLSATLSAPNCNIKCRLLSTDNNIYCIGGWTGSPGNHLAVDTVDVFDPVTETLVITMYLNRARYAFTATLWNDGRCLIVAGGTNITSSFDSIEIFGDCTAAPDFGCNTDDDCEFGFVCETQTNECMRDCDLMAIDDYLLQCSTGYAQHDDQIENVTNQIQTINDNLISRDEFDELVSTVEYHRKRIDAFTMVNNAHDVAANSMNNADATDIKGDNKDLLILSLLVSNMILICIVICFCIKSMWNKQKETYQQIDLV